jgi:membrane protease YdiL (CAAX protease family)
VFGIALTGKWRAEGLGLTRPFSGAGYILLAGVVACAAIFLGGLAVRNFGPGYSVPLTRSWQYCIWALEQEFILQGIFFLRLEEIVGGRRAVFASAALFAVAHIPNAVLTVLSLCGGVLFCELFRRARNLYPLGVIHAALGLTIARSFPDRWLHHMRVGIAYLIHH